MILIAAIAGASPAGASPAPTPAPLFALVVLEIKAHLAAPVRLPSKVLYGGTDFLYATLAKSTSKSYEITLTTDMGCRSAACVVGRVLSEPKSSGDGPLRSPQKVALADGALGIAGTASDPNLPAITWSEHGRRYTLELYVKAFPTDLVTMANSMTTY